MVSSADFFRLARPVQRESRTRLCFRGLHGRAKPGGETKMGLLSTAVLAFSLSTDAFAVSISKGAAARKPCIRNALRTGAVFGTVEGATPVIGWAAGLAASGYVQAVDHWIAFFVLGGIGLKMIFESLRAQESEEEQPGRPGLARLVLTAIGTSIDSMAVGLSLSMLGMGIGATALATGCATFTMVTIGMTAGQYLGSRFGRAAEALGGAGLLFLGTHTLLAHLGHI